MDIFDAFRLAICEGKKIRCRRWLPSGFIHFDFIKKRFLDENGKEFIGVVNWMGSSYPNDMEWDIYKEETKTITFGELKVGQKFYFQNATSVFMKIPEFQGDNAITINSRTKFADDAKVQPIE